MNAAQQAETIALQRQVHGYLDTLVTAGLDERVVVTAVMAAACERVLVAGTPTSAAAWLRGYALLIEKHGQAMRDTLLKS